MHISQNTPCLPPNAPPPPPRKSTIYIAFAFPSSWVYCNHLQRNWWQYLCKILSGGGRRTRSINMGDVQIECIEDKFLVTTPPPPEFQVTGGKTQHPKKSLGLPTKPPKIPCRIKFPRHKNFQKAYWISKKIPAWIKLPKNILAKIFLTMASKIPKQKTILRTSLSLEIQSTPRTGDSGKRSLTKE